MVKQEFFLPETSFFQSQFVYSGSILETRHTCDFSKKGKIFENLGKNVQNLKIFLKSEVIACDYIIFLLYVKIFSNTAYI